MILKLNGKNPVVCIAFDETIPVAFLPAIVI